MNLPLVTISIPVFKCENFIERCLNSVYAQTYDHIEVHLVNDQTQDNAVEVIENYLKNGVKFPTKLVHNDTNGGLSVVRNRGIDEANGKYLYYLDSDDEITPDCIQKLVQLAEKTNAQVTYANLICIDQKTKERKNAIEIKSDKTEIKSQIGVFDAFMNGELVTYAVNKLILVSFFRENKIYFVPGLFAQDELWSFQAALKVSRIALLKDITYHYYLHEGSVIHNRNKRNFDNWITIGQHMKKAWEQEKDPYKKKKIVAHLVHFKNMTLQMNWKAQKNDELWKYSYNAYKKLPKLQLWDYFSEDFSSSTKKMNFLDNLPTSLGLKIFKKRWGA